jgi:hypothetical protein
LFELGVDHGKRVGEGRRARDEAGGAGYF